jgi:hypothetical protein
MLLPAHHRLIQRIARRIVAEHRARAVVADSGNYQRKRRMQEPRERK